VDEANAAEGGEVYDGGIHDDPEKVADRKQENINKRAKKEHDKYDDATDHGATQGNRSR